MSVAQYVEQGKKSVRCPPLYLCVCEMVERDPHDREHMGPLGKDNETVELNIPVKDRQVNIGS